MCRLRNQISRFAQNSQFSQFSLFPQFPQFSLTLNRNLFSINNLSRTRIRLISTDSIVGDELSQRLNKPEIKLPKFNRAEIHEGYRIVAGIVLTRSPIILRDPHPFEREYYIYQQRLEQLHAAPFPVDFYFKKGSVAEKKWRERKAKEWSESLLSFSGTKDIIVKKDNGGDVDLSDTKSSSTGTTTTTTTTTSSSSSSSSDDEEIKIASRITAADIENDVKSLDRVLQRTLYLIVKKPRNKHAWQFPQGGVEKPETLLQTATRELEEECGNHMDVWFVGRRPIGYYKYEYPEGYSRDLVKYTGAKVFFMKAHIFSGQVRVDNKEIVDFAWVTKQEMENYVHPDFYNSIKDMLSEL
ncbi:hypothetical protein Glove_423g17 [Diversispora epigaea]|uniref:Large ribosomal subunit protein mL46 n=1 Tax=Diversispora epigaea TaxID=1348612 RepID=A0A397GV97_9GLOM|nr:hypothetical protein Glove_423g17 [Diversispora epigaea]